MTKNHILIFIVLSSLFGYLDYSFAQESSNNPTYIVTNSFQFQSQQSLLQYESTSDGSQQAPFLSIYTAINHVYQTFSQITDSMEATILLEEGEHFLLDCENILYDSDSTDLNYCESSTNIPNRQLQSPFINFVIMPKHCYSDFLNEESCKSQKVTVLVMNPSLTFNITANFTFQSIHFDGINQLYGGSQSKHFKAQPKILCSTNSDFLSQAGLPTTLLGQGSCQLSENDFIDEEFELFTEGYFYKRFNGNSYRNVLFNIYPTMHESQYLNPVLTIIDCEFDNLFLNEALIRIEEDHFFNVSSSNLSKLGAYGGKIRIFNSEFDMCRTYRGIVYYSQSPQIDSLKPFNETVSCANNECYQIIIQNSTFTNINPYNWRTNAYFLKVNNQLIKPTKYIDSTQIQYNIPIHKATVLNLQQFPGNIIIYNSTISKSENYIPNLNPIPYKNYFCGFISSTSLSDSSKILLNQQNLKTTFSQIEEMSQYLEMISTIFISNHSHYLFINTSTFHQNFGLFGGAITYHNSQDFKGVKDNYIQEEFEKYHIIIANSSFLNNYAYFSGGALHFILNSNHTSSYPKNKICIDTCEFSHNNGWTPINGGAVTIRNVVYNSSISIEDYTFLNISNSNFEFNKASFKGTALYVDNIHNIQVKDSTFLSNQPILWMAKDDNTYYNFYNSTDEVFMLDNNNSFLCISNELDIFLSSYISQTRKKTVLPQIKGAFNAEFSQFISNTTISIKNVTFQNYGDPITGNPDELAVDISILDCDELEVVSCIFNDHTGLFSNLFSQQGSQSIASTEFMNSYGDFFSYPNSALVQIGFTTNYEERESSKIFSDCHFENNQASATFLQHSNPGSLIQSFAPLSSSSFSTFILTDCSVLSNAYFMNSAQFYISDNQIQIYDSTFKNNGKLEAIEESEGKVFRQIQNDAIFILQRSFHENTLTGNSYISSCTFAVNSALSCASISIKTNETDIIERNDITSFIIEDNELQMNIGYNRGGGISISTYSFSYILESNSFSYLASHADYGALVVSNLFHNAYLEINNCEFTSIISQYSWITLDGTNNKEYQKGNVLIKNIILTHSFFSLSYTISRYFSSHGYPILEGGISSYTKQMTTYFGQINRIAYSTLNMFNINATLDGSFSYTHLYYGALSKYAVQMTNSNLFGNDQSLIYFKAMSGENEFIFNLKENSNLYLDQVTISKCYLLNLLTLRNSHATFKNIDISRTNSFSNSLFLLHDNSSLIVEELSISRNSNKYIWMIYDSQASKTTCILKNLNVVPGSIIDGKSFSVEESNFTLNDSVFDMSSTSESKAYSMISSTSSSIWLNNVSYPFPGGSLAQILFSQEDNFIWMNGIYAADGYQALKSIIIKDAQEVHLKNLHFNQTLISIEIINIENSYNATFDNITFEFSKIRAISVQSQNLLLKDSQFLGSSLHSQYGGCMYLDVVQAEFKNISIKNYQSNYGGAAFITSTLSHSCSPTLKISNSEFSTCEAIQGGGLFINASIKVNITDSVFSNNSAYKFVPSFEKLLDGGAIFYNFSSQENNPLIISSTKFTQNLADSGSIIRYLTTPPQISENCIMNENIDLVGYEITGSPMHFKFFRTSSASQFDEVKDNQSLEYNCSSGISNDDPLLFQIEDENGLPLLLHNIYQLKLQIDDESLSSSSSQIQLINDIYSAKSGIITLNNFFLIGTPNNSFSKMPISASLQKNGLYEKLYEDLPSSFYFDVFLGPCQSGYILSDQLKCEKCQYGTYSLGEKYTQSICQDCMNNAKCFGGDAVYPKKGYWRSGRYSEYIVRCLNFDDSCLGYTGNLEDYQGECKDDEGYKGNACGTCKNGYYLSGVSCIQCENNQNNSFYLIGKIVLFGILFILLKYVKEKNHFHYVIAIFHCILISIISNSHVKWPIWIKYLFYFTNYFTVFTDITSVLGCYGNMTYFKKAWIFTGFPLLHYIFYSTVFFIYTWKTKEPKERFKQRLAKLFGLESVMFYPFMILQYFSLFSCLKINEDNYFLISDMNQSCFSNDHISSIIFLTIPFLIYAIGIPIIFFKFRKNYTESINLITNLFGDLKFCKVNLFYAMMAVTILLGISINLLVYFNLILESMLSLFIIMGLACYLKTSHHKISKEDPNEKENEARRKTNRFILTLSLFILIAVAGSGLSYYENESSDVNSFLTGTILPCSLLFFYLCIPVFRLDDLLNIIISKFCIKRKSKEIYIDKESNSSSANESKQPMNLQHSNNSLEN